MRSSNITLIVLTLINNLIINQEMKLFMKSKPLTCLTKNSYNYLIC